MLIRELIISRHFSQVAVVMEKMDKRNILRGTRRSAAIGNDHSTRFYIDMAQSREVYVDDGNAGDQPIKMIERSEEPVTQILKPKPKRFENYSPKKITAQDIEEKQRLASERKKKQNELKIEQAKKTSQQAIDFDQKVKPYLERIQTQNVQQGNSGKKWFSSALNFK